MMKVLLKPALLCVCVLSTFSLAAAPPGKRPYVTSKRILKYEELNYRGTLLDDQNNPVANASIRFPRKQQMFQSNRLGVFDLTANNGDTIVVSAAGFKTTNYVLGAEAQFVLTLDADNNNLPLAKSSVVQYPFNQVSAKESLASTGAVYNNDLIKSPVTSFRNAVTGRLAGLYTLQSSGLPGADNASLFLRGQSPIFIIDGVVTGITTFDLEEIESVTVLKDAVATAMLGIRGSRGAVVITTKKGSARKQQLSFTVQSAIQQPLQWNKPLDAFNYATLRNEALRNDGVPATSGLYYSQTALDAYRNNSDPVNYPNVDYRRAITNNTANFNRYTFSATGGNKSARYFVAAEHVNQGGFFKTDNELNTYNTNNNFRSYIIRSNVDLNITNKLTAGLYLLGRIQNTNEPGATNNTIINNLLNTPANSYPLRNADNTFGGTQLFQNNILAQTINSGYRQHYNRDVLVNLYLKQSLDDFVKGLWIKGRVAYTSSLTEDIDRSKSFAVFQQGASTITQYNTNGTQQNGNSISLQGRMDYEEFSVGYDRGFDKHNLSMLVLANRDNSTNAIDPQALPYTILGTSGRLAYNYDGKYLAEATFGWNGVNRFAPEGKTKLNFFPAVGLGWNINKESFFKSVTAFNSLKLYTSLGLNGWDNSGYFIYYPRYQDSPSPYFGTGAGTITAISEGTLANSNITYEKSRKFNIGLTGSLLNNRLSFTAEYFNNKYYDLVQQRGYNSTLLGNVYPNENIGRNRYYGVEGQLSWQQRIKDFQYFIALNATSVGSKVLYIDEVTQPFNYMYRTGKPVDQQYGYVAEGLFQSQAEINSSPTTVGYRAQPGDIKYKDLNGDGVINQNDQTTIGSTKPLFFYGVSLGAGWKGFDISALFQGVQNRNVYLSGNSYWAFQNFGLGQAYEHNLNRWTPQNGASATYPRLSYGPNPNNDAPSSFWVRSGDYFRLKNAEIGYTIPSTVVGKIGVSSVRVFANGYNLFTKSSSQLDGLSPESFTGGFPVLRLYNFGINVKF